MSRKTTSGAVLWLKRAFHSGSVDLSNSRTGGRFVNDLAVDAAEHSATAAAVRLRQRAVSVCGGFRKPRRFRKRALRPSRHHGGVPAGAQKVALPISASAQEQNKVEYRAYLPSWQIERVVPKGEKRRIWFLASLNPDCTSKGAIIVRLTGMPKSGTVTFEEIEAFPNMTAEDYKKCNTGKVPGTAVFYDPNPDFAGTDTFSGTEIYPFGRARKFEVKVSVE